MHEQSYQLEAKTIHRILEYNPKDGYKRNDENPLNGNALIVDESIRRIRLS